MDAWGTPQGLTFFSEVYQFELSVIVRWDKKIIQNDTMLRQITESVLINKVQEGQLINSKSEGNYFRIPRTVVVTQLTVSMDVSTVSMDGRKEIVSRKKN